MGPLLTRREFVGRATCAGALLAIGKPGFAAAQGTPAGRMFVSLNGSLTRGVSGVHKVVKVFEYISDDDLKQMSNTASQ